MSVSSLTEFERLESEFKQSEAIERQIAEEAARLSEIEEGHESQASDSCETISGIPAEAADGDSDDYDKRMSEIDEIMERSERSIGVRPEPPKTLKEINEHRETRGTQRSGHKRESERDDSDGSTDSSLAEDDKLDTAYGLPKRPKKRSARSENRSRPADDAPELDEFLMNEQMPGVSSYHEDCGVDLMTASTVSIEATSDASLPAPGLATPTPSSASVSGGQPISGSGMDESFMSGSLISSTIEDLLISSTETIEHLSGRLADTGSSCSTPTASTIAEKSAIDRSATASAATGKSSRISR